MTRDVPEKDIEGALRALREGKIDLELLTTILDSVLRPHFIPDRYEERQRIRFPRCLGVGLGSELVFSAVRCHAKHERRAARFV